MSQQVNIEDQVYLSQYIQLIRVRVYLLYDLVLPIQPVQFLRRLSYLYILEVKEYLIFLLILRRCCSCSVSLQLLFFLTHSYRSLSLFCYVFKSLKEAFCQYFSVLLRLVLDSLFFYQLDQLIIVSVHEKEGAQSSRGCFAVINYSYNNR